MEIEKKVMATKEKNKQWDGKSRPSTDKYRDNFDTIFGQKQIKELDESLKQSKANRKERELDKETQDYLDSLKDKL
jgi:hypothetical protein|tara:strand:+ start:52 stop:279 length:228 start_codon:yes stop_codon:yes gene_type:complete